MAIQSRDAKAAVDLNRSAVARYIQLASLFRRRIDAGDMLLLEEGHCLRDHAIAACGPRRGGWESRVEATSAA